jgi:uncharacterized membrane protein YfcA
MIEELIFYLMIGFAAQIVDGAIGMGYGVISTSLLLVTGVAPAPASAAVHLAEIFTSGASGWAHWRLGNVDRSLFRRLVLPGMIGGAIGAFAVSIAPDHLIKPVVSVYLLLMGLVLLVKAARGLSHQADGNHIGVLGFIGGLVDSFGGGWGPVVTSTLLAKGHQPHLAIGTANLVEFFVTIVQSAVFFVVLDLGYLHIVMGLVLGGVAAAPIAATLTKVMPARALVFTVGVMVSALNVRNLWLIF